MPLFSRRLVVVAFVLCSAVFMLNYTQLSYAQSDAVTADPVLVGAGDISRCNKTEDEATAKLLDAIPGTVFTLGDNAYPDGSAANFSDCYDPTWGRHKARTKPVPGNHDYHIAGAGGYFGYFGAVAAGPNGYYSYDLGAWHIIALNTEIDVTANSTEVAWLKADLAAHPAVCTLAYWHEPRFSSGSVHGSSTRSANIWQELYAAGADVVLNGHDHLYERFALQNPNGQADPQGIREFIAGTGGASEYPFTSPLPNSEVRNNQTPGVLKLTLHPTSYDWEFVPIAGLTFTDAGSANCVGAGSPPPNTPTNTPVNAPTNTPTNTPTPNDTPAATPTNTPTNTPANAPTDTPTPNDTPAATPTNTPSPSGDVIFADGFEAGNFSLWSASNPNEEVLRVSPAAALVGSQGMEVIINDDTSIYLTDDTPAAEPRYHANFSFDPNSIVMANGNKHAIFKGHADTVLPVLRVQFGFFDGDYQLRAGLLNDGTTWSNSSWFTISDAAHAIEVDWQAATAVDANNGSLAFWIDGVETAGLTDFDNDTRRIDSIRLGAVAAIDKGTQGTYFFDAFESSRPPFLAPTAKGLPWTQEQDQQEENGEHQLFLPAVQQ